MKKLQERIAQGEVIIIDGPMGTELERRGVPMHGEAWSAAALYTHPEVVRQAHEDYIRAGADIIITNTFASARHTLERTEMADQVRELNTRAVTLAKEAREATASDRPVYIAGSISTSFRGGTQEASANYREQAEILTEAGADFLIMEMMVDVQQSAYAIEAAVSIGIPVWVGFSCKIRNDDSQVVFRELPWTHSKDEDKTFAEALDSLLPIGGSLVSVMHSDIEATAPALRAVQERWDGPLGAYPESGRFVNFSWQFENVIPPEDFLSEAKKWVQMGTQVVGGCCGIGPEHIRLLREGLPSHVPAEQQSVS